MGPVITLVHCSDTDVDRSLVDGEVLVNRGKLEGIKEDEAVEKAKVATKGPRERSGVEAKNHIKPRHR